MHLLRQEEAVGCFSFFYLQEIAVFSLQVRYQRFVIRFRNLKGNAIVEGIMINGTYIFVPDRTHSVQVLEFREIDSSPISVSC